MCRDNHFVLCTGQAKQLKGVCVSVCVSVCVFTGTLPVVHALIAITTSRNAGIPIL